jgi:hypothetical protein
MMRKRNIFDFDLSHICGVGVPFSTGEDLANLRGAPTPQSSTLSADLSAGAE